MCLLKNSCTFFLILSANLLIFFHICNYLNGKREKVASLLALSLRILHRYSIASPSHVHRFDGVTMEYRWSNDGDTWEEKSSSNSELDLNWSYIGLESDLVSFRILHVFDVLRYWENSPILKSTQRNRRRCLPDDL